MRFDADLAYLTGLLLVFIRLSALFLLTPLFATTQLPIKVRLLLLFALSGTLVASLQISPAQIPHTLASFIFAAIYELIIGALLAFGLFAAFGVFQLGGRILDMQMGFGVANLIDPATNAQGPLLGTILNLTAVATFFLLDGHHMVIRGLAYSLSHVPVGQGLAQLQIDAVVAQFGRMFSYGLMLVAPAVFSLLLLDAGMAIIARTMPQLNIFIVGLPLKIFVGSMVLVFSLNYLGPLFKKIFESVFRYWEHVLI